MIPCNHIPPSNKGSQGPPPNINQSKAIQTTTQDVGYYAHRSPNLSKLYVPFTFEFPISVTPYLQSTISGISLGKLHGKTLTAGTPGRGAHRRSISELDGIIQLHQHHAHQGHHVHLRLLEPTALVVSTVTSPTLGSLRCLQQPNAAISMSSATTLMRCCSLT
jgi:hypothetical protein